MGVMRDLQRCNMYETLTLTLQNVYLYTCDEIMLEINISSLILSGLYCLNFFFVA